MSFPPQGNKADVSGLATVANQTTLLTRLSAARAGYLDQLDFNLNEAIAAIPTTAMRGTDGAALASAYTAARAGYLENVNNVVLKTLAAMRGTDGVPTTAMRGTDSAALASSWTAALATALGNYTAVRAGYLDAISRDRPDMVFPSVASAGPIIVIPGTGADLDFPSVVVAGLPAGITIARADYVVVIGGLFDTSGTENQIKTGTTDQIFVKKAATAWNAGSPTVIAALTFAALGLQVDADAYRGGPVLFGATDIKGVVTVDGTYNFRSEETTEAKGVEATAATIELLDVSSIIRVWFN